MPSNRIFQVIQLKRLSGHCRPLWFYNSRQWGSTVRKQDHMLWTISLVLIVLWVLGLVSSTTMGGFIHVLLVIAIITLLVGVIQGRR